MKITTVRFRRLQSHDRGYGHDAVEAEAQIDDGQTPEAAFVELREWVLIQLGRVRETDKLIDDLQRLRDRVVSEERTRDRLKGEVDGFRKVVRESDRLYKLAVEAGFKEEAQALFDLGADDIPF